MIPLETLCVQEVARYAETWAVKPENTFKLVNAMLDVIDRDGLYSAVLYLRVYDKSNNKKIGLDLLTAFNTILEKMSLFNLLKLNTAEVSEVNCKEVHTAYGVYLSGDDSSSTLAEMAMKRLLIHLRFATKGA